jgi:hypothetical protein
VLAVLFNKYFFCEKEEMHNVIFLQIFHDFQFSRLIYPKVIFESPSAAAAQADEREREKRKNRINLFALDSILASIDENWFGKNHCLMT